MQNKYMWLNLISLLRIHSQSQSFGTKTWLLFASQLPLHPSCTAFYLLNSGLLPILRNLWCILIAFPSLTSYYHRLPLFLVLYFSECCSTWWQQNYLVVFLAVVVTIIIGLSAFGMWFIWRHRQQMLNAYKPVNAAVPEQELQPI